MGNFKEDIALTEAFVFDVDGVMTDGSIMPLPGGDFLRRYNAKDGYALAYAVRQGYRVCVITGGHGATLERRLQMLGVKDFYMDCMDKIAVMRSYFEREGIDPAHVIYMGDDIPDLECMRMVGIPVCPADAASEVIEAARYVSEFNGGRGGRARHHRAGAPCAGRLGPLLDRGDPRLDGPPAVAGAAAAVGRGLSAEFAAGRRRPTDGGKGRKGGGVLCRPEAYCPGSRKSSGGEQQRNRE